MGKTGDLLVRVGSVLFAAGLIAVGALFLTPLVTDGDTVPLWMYLCTPLLPLGLITAIGGAVLGGVARRDRTDR